MLAEVQLEIHKEIIEASKRGNSRAQFKLYRLYSKSMFNICMRIMNVREDAEDMLQESFAEAFRKLETFRYEATFGAWLKRIVVNRCLNRMKKKSPDLVFTNDILPVEYEEPDFDNIELNVQKIHRAIRQLPDGYRVIFNLYLLEGYSHQEISQILGISESTSKTQYFRAKRKIKQILCNER